MPKMNLSHFEAAFLFSVLVSVVLGVVTKNTDRDRLHYGVYTFRLLPAGALRYRLADVPGPRLSGSLGGLRSSRGSPYFTITEKSRWIVFTLGGDRLDARVFLRGSSKYACPRLRSAQVL